LAEIKLSYRRYGIFEMANGFLVAERRGTFAAADIARAMEEVGLLLGPVIETASELVSMKQALATARNFKLTVYDAVYLETSMRQELPPGYARSATAGGRVRKPESKSFVKTRRACMYRSFISSCM
jgi:hypothetical protein